MCVFRQALIYTVCVARKVRYPIISLGLSVFNYWMIHIRRILLIPYPTPYPHTIGSGLLIRVDIKNSSPYLQNSDSDPTGCGNYPLHFYPYSSPPSTIVAVSRPSSTSLNEEGNSGWSSQPNSDSTKSLQVWSRSVARLKHTVFFIESPRQSPISPESDANRLTGELQSTSSKPARGIKEHQPKQASWWRGNLTAITRNTLEGW
jgi:hypothetical protein